MLAEAAGEQKDSWNGYVAQLRCQRFSLPQEMQ